MHEVSIMGDIFNIVNENIVNYKMKKVNKILLKVGEFTCVQEDALQFAFEAFSKDTVAEGAELIIDRVEATAKCSNCEEIFKITFVNKICPKCQTFSNNIVTGYELLLQEIEGE
ncbi:putative hydrogenase nickel incorporation protein HypA [Clostridium polyendosporum]|uniref:Hydrogenase maturation factor HypA n=1 Tax=Clostridium polyendosporum TaxID=69208 RepID=A0A919VKM4_9CLOT|nr:hydrogenase maturation nickel metallochaperone HypA [Clostridium polyendosporum]GIM27738.1 putative hydrogenase nickel incorporation protein HypA [Clostridium polyendosporum]